MDFLEKDLEEIIKTTYANDYCQLNDRGLDFECGNPLKVYRQKQIGNYGVADLIVVHKQYHITLDDKWEECFDLRNSNICITIFELKKDRIGISAFLQAIKYAKGIRRYLQKNRDFFNFTMRVVLIGKKLDTDGSFCFIPDLFCDYEDGHDCIPKGRISDVLFYTYKYGLEGITFHQKMDYKLIEEGFGDEI